MPKLDSPLKTSATNAAIWTTVSKDGVRYSLQVFLDGQAISDKVAALIEANPDRHNIEAHNDTIKVHLTRQS